MNRDRILAVAAAIEGHTIPGLGFNMQRFATTESQIPDHSGQECGTVACIAGWAFIMKNSLTPAAVVDIVDDEDDSSDILEESGDWLDLTVEQRYELFLAENHPTLSSVSSWSRIPQTQAIRTLRHLAATGEVDWTV